MWDEFNLLNTSIRTCEQALKNPEVHFIYADNKNIYCI